MKKFPANWLGTFDLDFYLLIYRNLFRYHISNPPPTYRWRWVYNSKPYKWLYICHYILCDKTVVNQLHQNIKANLYLNFFRTIKILKQSSNNLKMETPDIFSFSLVTLPKNVPYLLIFIVFITYLVIKSFSVQYNVKNIFYVAGMNCIAILMIPLFLLRLRNVKNLVWVVLNLKNLFLEVTIGKLRNFRARIRRGKTKI